MRAQCGGVGGGDLTFPRQVITVLLVLGYVQTQCTQQMTEEPLQLTHPPAAGRPGLPCDSLLEGQPASLGMGEHSRAPQERRAPSPGFLALPVTPDQTHLQRPGPWHQAMGEGGCCKRRCRGAPQGHVQRDSTRSSGACQPPPDRLRAGPESTFQPAMWPAEKGQAEGGRGDTPDQRPGLYYQVSRAAPRSPDDSTVDTQLDDQQAVSPAPSGPELAACISGARARLGYTLSPNRRRRRRAGTSGDMGDSVCVWLSLPGELRNGVSELQIWHPKSMSRPSSGPLPVRGDSGNPIAQPTGLGHMAEAGVQRGWQSGHQHKKGGSCPSGRPHTSHRQDLFPGQAQGAIPLPSVPAKSTRSQAAACWPLPGAAVCVPPASVAA